MNPTTRALIDAAKAHRRLVRRGTVFRKYGAQLALSLYKRDRRSCYLKHKNGQLVFKPWQPQRPR